MKTDITQTTYLLERSAMGKVKQIPVFSIIKHGSPEFAMQVHTSRLSGMEETIQELADSIFREKVLRARKQSVSERFDDGIALFEGAVIMMKSGIRHQFPDSSEKEVEFILRKRLRRLKQVEDHGIYEKVEIQTSA